MSEHVCAVWEMGGSGGVSARIAERKPSVLELIKLNCYSECNNTLEGVCGRKEQHNLHCRVGKLLSNFE